MRFLPSGEILQALYDHEINFGLSCFWDEGFEWRLGDDRGNGVVFEGIGKTVAEAVLQLAEAASRHKPGSDFAVWWTTQ